MAKRYRKAGKKRPHQIFGEASLLQWVEFMGGKDALERMKKWPSQKHKRKEKRDQS